MRECPLSRHLGMEAPASPVPPTLAGAFSFQLAMTVLPLLQGLVLRSRAILADSAIKSR